MRHYGLLLSFVLFLGLSGCHTPPPKVSPSPTGQKTAQTRWEAAGRMAVSQKGKGGNAQFLWQQNNDTYKIRLFGPFGAGAVWILGDAHRVALQEANGKITTAATPELLLARFAGWQVPLTGLHYWLRGLPVPDAPVSLKQMNSQGKIKRLVQQGWTIEYENYTAGYPQKLQLTNGPVKVKMIITQWNFDATR